jgi:hypothetical protein
VTPLSVTRICDHAAASPFSAMNVPCAAAGIVVAMIKRNTIDVEYFVNIVLPP